MAESPRQQFVALAQEIVQRIEQCTTGQWWFEVKSLAERLEEIRKMFDDRQQPAFLVLFLDPDSDWPESIPSDSRSWVLRNCDSACLVVSSDPITGDLGPRFVVWRSVERVQRLCGGGYDATRQKAVACLQNWIRAIENGLITDRLPLRPSDEPKRKPGRPRQANIDTDRKIYEAWRTGRFKTYEDLAVEYRMTKDDVKKTIDRVRKQRNKS